MKKRLLNPVYGGLVILLAALLLWLGTALPMLTGGRFNHVDFNCFYLWGLAARHGLNPYVTNLQPLADSEHLDIQGMNLADYPPTFILCFESLAFLRPKAAYLAWVALNVSAFAAVLFILLGKTLSLSTRSRVLLAGLAILYFPVTFHFYWAQAQIVLLLLLVLANRWLLREKEMLAGSAIAFGGLLKVFPLYLLAYLLLRRRWRALLCAGVGIAIGIAVTIALLGTSVTFDFVFRLRRLATGNWLAEHGLTGGANLIALGPVAVRLYTGLAHSAAAPTAPSMRLVAIIPQLVLLALTAYATLINTQDWARDEYIFSLWVVTAVLLSPTAWIHYMVLLILPYVVLAKAAAAGRASQLAIVIGVASYALTQAWAIALAAIAFVAPPAILHALEQNWFCLMTLLVYIATFLLAVARPALPLSPAAVQHAPTPNPSGVV